MAVFRQPLVATDGVPMRDNRQALQMQKGGPARSPLAFDPGLADPAKPACNAFVDMRQAPDL